MFAAVCIGFGTACLPEGTLTEGVDPPAPGSLTVSIQGLPAGRDAAIRVTSPQGYDHRVSTPEILSGLLPGDYVVTAQDVLVDGERYTPAPPAQSVSVRPGASLVVQVAYEVATARLQITLTGVPAGASAAVLVTGAGFIHTTTTSELLTGLAPGSYHIQAPSILADGDQYRASPESSDVTLLPGATPVPLAINFALATGRLAVQVSGLPGGVVPPIEVTGPDGFRQPIPASQLLTGLTPGDYAITAGSFSAGGLLYQATPALQSVTIGANPTAQSVAVTYAAAPGSISITTSGLPPGATPLVAITGPSGYAAALNQSQILSNLTPGTYSITAADVTSGGITYSSQPAVQHTVVISGGQVAALVQYVPTTGILSLVIAGVPGGTSPSLTVSGPAGFSRTLTASESLSGLAPGLYTVAAANLESGGQTYAPVPASQTQSVAPGGTTTATVVFAVSTGDLAVSIAGLPGGVNASVTVSGTGFSQTLTGSQSLSGLSPGNYSVSAAAVTSGGTTYTPTPASQIQTVTSGATASASVSYTVGTGGLSVTVSGLPAGVNASMTVSGTGFSQTLTGSQTLSGLAPGSYSVSAAAVTSGGTTYNPTPATQTRTVTSGATASASVGYASSGSTLDLHIDGAYLTQATQRYDGSVPLVAGRDAYLRVFTVANQANGAQPQVRVRLYNGTALIQTYILAAPATSVPASVNEGVLTSSWNVLVPGAVVQAGLRLLADVDPGNGVAESNEGNNQFPLSGIAGSVDVRSLPTFAVRLVPVRQSVNGLQGNVSSANQESFLADLKRLLPIGPYDADVRAPYTTTAPVLGNAVSWSMVLLELNALRSADASSRYYYGVAKVTYTSGIAGIASVGGRLGLGWDYLPSGASVMAHEVGHGMGRQHAPCGGAAAPDPSYPYAGAQIGAWGLDLATLTLKPPASQFDIMGYCNPKWISDYNWNAMLAFRQNGPNNAPDAGSSPGNQGLLIWGRITAAGIQLEPAFQVPVAGSSLPDPGPNRLDLVATDGSLLRSVAFDASEIVDLPGGSERHFAFVVPLAGVAQARLGEVRVVAGARMASRLAGSPAGADPAMVLSRPSPGQIELRWDAARFPVAMIRDAASGQVLSFARGGSARLLAPGQDFQLQFSDGVRTLTRAARVLR